MIAAEESPGATIGGRFRIERALGEGGMGMVHAAVDLVTGARVALKRMRPELLDDPRAVERFRREGEALAAIAHPAIVAVREVGVLEDGAPYLAMELLEGETLEAHLARVGRMSPSALVPWIRALAAGLAAAHAAGVIHRDIKPSNVHLTGGDPPVKLVDFGVARVAHLGKMTSTGLTVGTVRYMSPEQLTGAPVDERADVYALGVVLYEALAGEHPFARTATDDPVGAVLVGRHTPLSSLRPDLPPAVTRVVQRAMARLPTDRFGDAPSFADAFELAAQAHVDDTRDGAAAYDPRLVAALAPTAPATPVFEPRSRVRAKPKKRRPPAWLLAPLIVGVCVVPGLGGVAFFGCGHYMTDVQMRVAMQNVRATAEANPEALPDAASALDDLARLHDEEQVNLFAAAAFNARVQYALRGDDTVDVGEAEWVLETVRDIVDRGGDYDLDRYGVMTQGLDDR